jgi:hypothetical protein
VGVGEDGLGLGLLDGINGTGLANYSLTAIILDRTQQICLLVLSTPANNVRHPATLNSLCH